MAVAYVGARGTGANGAFGATVTFTTTATITSGNHVVVAVEWVPSAGAAAVASVTVGALSLTVDDTHDATPTRGCEVWSARASSGISSGATVTVTLDAASGDAKIAACVELSGIKSTGYLDVSGASRLGFGSDQPTASVSNTVADAFAFAAFSISGALTLNSVTNAWTVGPQTTEAGSAEALGTAYKVLSATGSQSTTATWSSTGGGDAVIVIYKGDTVTPSEKVGAGVVGP